MGTESFVGSANIAEGAVEFGTPEWEARFGGAENDSQDPGDEDGGQLVKDMPSKPRKSRKAKPTTNMAEAKAAAKDKAAKEKADAKAARDAERQAAKDAAAKERAEGPGVEDIVAKKPAMKATVQNIPLELLDGIDGGDPVGKDFVENVRLHGILTPIRVRPVEDGRYNIIYGKRRSQAARALEFVSIPAVVEKDATSNDFTQALAENNARSHNIIEEHRMVMQLIEDERTKGDTGANDRRAVAKISKATGMTVAQVKKARDVGRLVPELMSAVEDGAMSSWSALNAARMPTEVQDRLVAVLNERGRVTADDVLNERRARQVGAVVDAQGAASESGQDLYGDPEDDGESDGADAPSDPGETRSMRSSRARISITEAIRNLEGMGAKSESERDALTFLAQALDLLNS